MKHNETLQALEEVGIDDFCHWSLVVLLWFFGITAISGCNFPVEPPAYHEPPLPALSDSVPFESLGNGKIVFERIGPFANNYSGIYVIDLDRKISSAIDQTGLCYGPVVSPSGQAIAYTAYYDNKTLHDVFIMNIDGSNRVNISSTQGQDHFVSWSPDTRQIFFVGAVGGAGLPVLYRQSPTTNPADRVLVKDFSTIDPPSVYVPTDAISASPTGKLVVCTYGIHTMNADGSNFKTIVSSPQNEGFLCSPVWSPDGQNIAFMSIVRDTKFCIRGLSIILTDPDGIRTHTLVTLSASDSSEWHGDKNYSLCWSPDGSKILFNRPDGDQVGAHIYVMNKDGSNLLQVTTAVGVTDRSLSWSL
jgi:Tol biopolymer transport system component